MQGIGMAYLCVHILGNECVCVYASTWIDIDRDKDMNVDM